MAFAQFTDDLRLGHALIDAQHASLFEAVNRLHEAMLAGDSRQQVGEILAFMRIYTLEHFATEEAFMQEIGFPEMAEHKTEHDELIRQVQDLEAKHASGSITLSLTTMAFLRDWLSQHIHVEDHKLVRYLRRG
ncbi:MAG: bacteriohemerythrin [Holophagaceae bacterium]